MTHRAFSSERIQSSRLEKHWLVNPRVPTPLLRGGILSTRQGGPLGKHRQPKARGLARRPLAGQDYAERGMPKLKFSRIGAANTVAVAPECERIISAKRRWPGEMKRTGTWAKCRSSPEISLASMARICVYCAAGGEDGQRGSGLGAWEEKPFVLGTRYSHSRALLVRRYAEITCEPSLLN